ncbi:hypothetical protein PG993_012376 [Apiospora rasikravindrae]|uniref:Uncharacterized protein n=1 Tax=Apiospora rasikravindrae TaxID=990691 RepID=A0ABR1S2E5_9PEZI
MDNYPTPPYSYAYGDLASEMMPEQSFYDFGGQGMPAFDGSMADTPGYQHDYTQQEYHANMIDPTGVKSDSAVDLGFDDFMYNNYGELPGVPSPAPTVPSSRITAPGTPLGFHGDFNTPQPQAIGPRPSQCSGTIQWCAHLY